MNRKVSKEDALLLRALCVALDNVDVFFAGQEVVNYDWCWRMAWDECVSGQDDLISMLPLLIDSLKD